MQQHNQLVQKAFPKHWQTRSRPELKLHWAETNLALLWQEFQRNARKIFFAIG
jgi:hypothetical protein